MLAAIASTARSQVYEPPPVVASCLDGAHILAAGPSELAGLLAWLTGGAPISTRRNTARMREAERTQAVEWNRLAAARSLACSTRRNLGDRHFQCMGNYRVRAACREDLYKKTPFEANCSGITRPWRNASFSVTYVWKSYQYSHADEHLHAAAVRRLRSHRRVIVVLSAGLQEFGRFAEHRETLLHNVRDDEPWPQSWMDSYVARTSQLFQLFSEKWGRHTPTPCVVWRAQNIAARHANYSEPKHHPSAVNGVHHWLNRISIALAKLNGLKVVDLTPATISRKPLDHSVDGNGWMTARRVDALEGDVYHGYRISEIAPLFLEALSVACCESST
ncbi:hypothetical protein AB1Y20_016787 [Prymnesium parvum]|uniref:Uncharacterized protein n=1 Tax=Prymnesium parvum TaxID=97485 RepID=A0AB34IC32_PRYPA